MMKRLLCVLGLVFGLFLGHSAQAAGVAKLDVKAAMAQHPKTAQALKDLETYRKAQFQVKTKNWEAEFQKRLKGRKFSDLSEDEREEIFRLRQEFEDGFERDVEKKDQELTRPILKDIENVVQALAKEMSFDVVVDVDAVFFGGQDITNTVVSRLKK